MFRFLQRPLMLLAGLGLLASLGAHAASLLGLAVPWPLVNALNLGVVLLAVLGLLMARPVFRGRPGCWQVFLVLLLGYAAVNFYLAVGRLLLDFGLPTPSLAEVPAPWVRAFSGIWLFLYAADVAAFFPPFVPPHGAEHALRCPFGHFVPAGAALCPVCEWRVERE